MDKTKQVFGALIVYVLLILYVIVLTVIVLSTIEEPTSIVIPPLQLTVVTTIGGLISSLIIAKLSVTVRDENLTQSALRMLDFKKEEIEDYKTSNNVLVTILVYTYIIVWILAGITTLSVALFDGDLPEGEILTEIGLAWLGLAVGAGYSFFGINPES